MIGGDDNTHRDEDILSGEREIPEAIAVFVLLPTSSSSRTWSHHKENLFRE
jgi:hypothetical protein